jgi:thioredoxin
MSVSDLFKKNPVAGKPEKVTDQTFEAEVLSAPGPVLVDFWAPWCGPCRLLGGLIEEIAPEYAGRIRILKLNVDDSPQTAARYGVSSIPTMIFFKDGQIVDRLVGALPLNPLRQKIESHAAGVPSGSTSSEGAAS